MPVINPSKIKKLIFDLGGVLLNINPLLSLIELEKVSGIAQKELIAKLTEAHLFEKFDTGSLTEGEFRCELCRILGKKEKDSEIDRIWNALLLDFPRQRVELLQKLRKNYSVYLLSNTNSIHFKEYSRAFHESYKINFFDLFDRLFLSHEIGIHKPDAGIYTYVLQQAGLDASECVFF
jgi:glucose-1-phosphatase